MEPEELKRLQEFADRLKEDPDASRLTLEEIQELTLLLLKHMREQGMID